MEQSKHTLENGISVLIDRDERAETACALVGVGIGSNHEEEDEHGLAHFFEHMCFKGTDAHPNQRDLLAHMDGLGIVANAFTSREYTAYYAHGRAERLDDMLQITADIFLRSLFDGGEVEKEKGVVLEEIAMYEDDPREKGSETVEMSLFAGTPSGHSIIGTADSVRSFSRDRFVSFFEKHYTTGNTVISLAGNVDPEYAVRRLNSLYATASVGDRTGQVRVDPDGPATAHESIVRKDMEQMRVTIGGYAPSARSDDRHAAVVFATLFGGSMSSRLFLRVREEMGACYDIAACNEMQAHTGLHAVGAGIPAARTEEVMRAIADECGKVRKEAVSSDELRRAKEQVLGRLFVARESVGNRAIRQAISYTQTDAVESDDAFAKKIDAVSADDVRRVARETYDPRRLALCYIGNRAVPESCSDAFFDRLA